jgi:DNA-binding MurR/RpiR family transcriptional regulator
VEEFSEGSLFERIDRLAEELSPRLERLAKYLYENRIPAGFLNSSALARAAGVSEATVTRLAIRLGYRGFPELRAALGEAVRSRISSLERASLEEETGEEPLFRRVLNLEATLTRELAEGLPAESFERAVEMLDEADRVLVAGVRPSACLTEYFAFHLGVLRRNVHALTGSELETRLILRDSAPRTVGVLFSFPRYPAATERIGRVLREREIPLIGITDGPLSPIAPLCTELLRVPVRFVSFIDPYAGAMALIHALLIGVYLRNPARTRKELAAYEDAVAREGYFLRPDLDILNLL